MKTFADACLILQTGRGFTVDALPSVHVDRCGAPERASRAVLRSRPGEPRFADLAALEAHAVANLPQLGKVDRFGRTPEMVRRSILDMIRTPKDTRRARCTNPRRTRRVFAELRQLRAERTADRIRRHEFTLNRQAIASTRRLAAVQLCLPLSDPWS